MIGSAGPRQDEAAQAAGKPVGAVILRSPALRDDEECRISMKMRRARAFAEFTLSDMTKILLPQGGIRVTAKGSG
jgi:hypothetical protein